MSSKEVITSMGTDEESSWLFEPEETPKTQLVSKKSVRRIVTPIRIYFTVLHILLVGSITALLIRRATTDNCSSASKTKQSWSPVQPHIEYELRQEYASEHTSSNFSGEPSPQQDRAWDDLVRPSFFRVTREELEKAGSSFDDIVELTDGGYIATLGVYHELHCVRQLRFYLGKDRYYPNLTQAQEEYLQYHLDHCLEALRHAVMCHGSTALRSFAWVDKSAVLPQAQSNAMMSCVKWSSIYDWSQSRAVPYNPSLVRPSV